MQIKTSYIVVVNGKKYYKKTIEEANKFYDKKKDLFKCELIVVNKKITHKQLNFLD